MTFLRTMLRVVAFAGVLCFAPVYGAEEAHDVSHASIQRVVDEAIKVLSDVPSHGIDTAAVDLQTLRAIRGRAAAEGWPTDWNREIYRLVADSLLAVAVDLHVGRAEPSQQTVTELRAALDAALRSDDIWAWYATLFPADLEYDRLRLAFVRLRAVSPWPTIGAGPTLRSGDSGPRVGRLRARLGLDPDAAVMDSDLIDAVLAYQARHGMEADGLVGGQTVRHLDVSHAARLQQVRSNLERWRKIDIESTDREIRINLPSYELEYREADRPRGTMRVVIGNQKNKTPLLRDTVEYLVFSPHWYVPERIARQEIIPRLKDDAGYLQRMKFDVLSKANHQPLVDIDWSSVARSDMPYYFRQQPGPQNSLGRLKFIFPNPENIYLHDTSAPQLFQRSRRAFSHGCIRVEDPQALARWLLQNAPQWDGVAIDTAMSAGKPRRVVLDQPVPIVTTYFTAASGADGQVRFFEDIYGYDVSHDQPMASTYLLTSDVLDVGSLHAASD